MKMVKIRRIGNSNMVALPKDWEDDGFAPGTYVPIERDQAGEIRMLRAGEMIAKHAEALRILLITERTRSGQHAFLTDLDQQDAVLWRLYTVADAASELPDDLKARPPEIRLPLPVAVLVLALESFWTTPSFRAPR